ncbi:MAG: S9 family peptidase [Silvibacterium sp.]|nr:S9 family peptidase [Silvibacterium sp.]
MGSEVNALMIRPPDFDAARKYPAIVYIAGGPGEQIIRDRWGGETFLWLRMMAQKGYIIYAQDGHGTSGRGHVFEEPIHLRLSAQEMADERDGVNYLRTLPYVDAARVGIYGWGYGGFLALHGMFDLPIAYKAGIAGAPITDWRLYDAVFAERYLKDPVRNQDGYLNSMPTENAKNLRGPLLLAQGMADQRVHIENSFELLNEFLETAKYPAVMFVPDRRHFFEDRDAKLALYRTMTDFFLKNL